MSSITYRCNSMLKSKIPQSIFPSMHHVSMIHNDKNKKVSKYTTMQSSNVYPISSISKRRQICVTNEEKHWERNHKELIHGKAMYPSLVTKNKHEWIQQLDVRQDRMFHTEMEFHDVADETLENIQDCIEEQFENDKDEIKNIPEVNVSSGVLTLSLGSHGTWVINKQTPNRQIWWSSPISGPRRYEYDNDNEVWVYTRRLENEESGMESSTLGSILTEEIKELYDIDLDLKV